MNLKHNFLVAMPSLQDPLFNRSLIYICEHSKEDGTIGLIVNKPMGKLTIGCVLKNLNINVSEYNVNIKLNHPVLIGGPLAGNRGFILYSSAHVYSSSIHIAENTLITTSRDVLESLCIAKKPEHILVALGYCAWKKDQLEKELLENSWLTIPAKNNILFTTPLAERWRAAALSIGVDIYNITSEVGHS